MDAQIHLSPPPYPIPSTVVRWDRVHPTTALAPVAIPADTLPTPVFSLPLCPSHPSLRTRMASVRRWCHWVRVRIMSLYPPFRIRSNRCITSPLHFSTIHRTPRSTACSSPHHSILGLLTRHMGIQTTLHPPQATVASPRRPPPLSWLLPRFSLRRPLIVRHRNIITRRRLVC